jgi:hypothetical protein
MPLYKSLIFSFLLLILNSYNFLFQIFLLLSLKILLVSYLALFRLSPFGLDSAAIAIWSVSFDLVTSSAHHQIMACAI